MCSAVSKTKCQKMGHKRKGIDKLSDKRKRIDMDWWNANKYEYGTMMRRRGMISIELVKP
jgi:hypothetical protein